MFKQGDKLKLTRTETKEITVSSVLPSSCVRGRDGVTYHLAGCPGSSKNVWDYEILEPEYKAGHAYVSNGGHTYLRTCDEKWLDNNGCRREDDYPGRPMRELT